MGEIDAWTDIFESQKRVISNFNASKSGHRVKGKPVLKNVLSKNGDVGNTYSFSQSVLDLCHFKPFHSHNYGVENIT